MMVRLICNSELGKAGEVVAVPVRKGLELIRAGTAMQVHINDQCLNRERGITDRMVTRG